MPETSWNCDDFETNAQHISFNQMDFSYGAIEVAIG
jgi:hypothetical protein